VFAVRDAELPALGRRLRNLRFDQRRGQKTVALAVGISVSTYSRIETGDAVPTHAQLRAIARALCVTLAELAAD
jgi:transcriptional regulator with XRE-family HTH domain